MEQRASSTTETWEERIARERKEEKEKCENIRAIIADVAKHLSDNSVFVWKLDEKKNQEFSSPSGQISCGNMALWLRCETYGKNAFVSCRISGVYPRNNDGSYVEVYDYDANHNRVNAPSINVNINKGAAKIAADINKRLLPAYMARLAKVEERIKANNDFEDTTKTTLETLAAAADVALDEYDYSRKAFSVDGVKLPSQEYEARAFVKASKDDISLELSNIDIETAKKIIVLIQGE